MIRALSVGDKETAVPARFRFPARFSKRAEHYNPFVTLQKTRHHRPLESKAARDHPCKLVATAPPADDLQRRDVRQAERRSTSGTVCDENRHGCGASLHVIDRAARPDGVPRLPKYPIRPARS